MGAPDLDEPVLDEPGRGPPDLAGADLAGPAFGGTDLGAAAGGGTDLDGADLCGASLGSATGRGAERGTPARGGRAAATGFVSRAAFGGSGWRPAFPGRGEVGEVAFRRPRGEPPGRRGSGASSRYGESSGGRGNLWVCGGSRWRALRQQQLYNGVRHSVEPHFPLVWPWPSTLSGLEALVAQARDRGSAPSGDRPAA